jgi:hypothetical protein
LGTMDRVQSNSQRKVRAAEPKRMRTTITCFVVTEGTATLAVLDAETGEDARRDSVSTQHCSEVVFGRVVVKVKKP